MIQDGDRAATAKDKENEKMAVLKSEIKRFHRFHGYDYSRGAVLFITFGLKKRLPVFGRAEGDKVVYNKVRRGGG